MKPLAILISTVTAALGLRVVDEKAFAKSVNYVGFKLFRQLKNDIDNPMLSTLSISAILSLLYLGAGENTLKELKDYLGYEKFRLEEPSKVFKDYLKRITYDNDDDYVFTMANAILLENEFPIKKNYRTIVKENYLTDIANVNFTGGAALVSEVVNDWMKIRTRGKIDKLLAKPLSRETKLFILSGVFFRGDWKFKFHRLRQEKKKFYNRGNISDTTDVNMLYLNSRCLYARFDSFTAIELPYLGDTYSLLVVLPDKLDGAYDIQSNFTDETFDQINWDLYENHVEIYLPKMAVKSSLDLQPLMKNSGLTEIWTSSADLDKMIETKGLYLTDGRHSVDFGIREGLRNRPPPSPKGDMPQGTFLGDADEQFLVDHPFFFFVIDTDFDMAIIEGRIDEL